MQDGYIAVAHDPFRLFHERSKIEMVDDPHRSIASSRTNHGLYRIVIQHLLKIGKTLLVLAGKLVPRSEDICAQLNLQSPFLKNPEAGMYLLKVQVSSRGNDAYLVVFIQIRW